MNDIQIIQTTRHIVFYDGECGLCQRSVQWLLNRDKKKILFYAPLQGETAKELLTSIEFPEGLDSIIYLQEEEGHNIVKWYSNAFWTSFASFRFLGFLVEYLYLYLDLSVMRSIVLLLKIGSNGLEEQMPADYQQRKNSYVFYHKKMRIGYNLLYGG